MAHAWVCGDRWKITIVFLSNVLVVDIFINKSKYKREWTGLTTFYVKRTWNLFGDWVSIQMGRANVKTTASLLNNFFWRGRSECCDWQTCVPILARCVLRRHFDAVASGLNRPWWSIQTGRANVKSTVSLLYKNYNAARPMWMLRLTSMCSKN